mmetsp:Transcript_1184/g.2603  ORF Transcript_1184/g.2603 Transcript_1184/m.2603 type:complete len:378 (+) Transcript_1184:585-1718(+)
MRVGGCRPLAADERRTPPRGPVANRAASPRLQRLLKVGPVERMPVAGGFHPMLLGRLMTRVVATQVGRVVLWPHSTGKPASHLHVADDGWFQIGGCGEAVVPLLAVFYQRRVQSLYLLLPRRFHRFHLRVFLAQVGDDVFVGEELLAPLLGLPLRPRKLGVQPVALLLVLVQRIRLQVDLPVPLQHFLLQFQQLLLHLVLGYCDLYAFFSLCVCEPDVPVQVFYLRLLHARGPRNGQHFQAQVLVLRLQLLAQPLQLGPLLLGLLQLGLRVFQFPLRVLEFGLEGVAVLLEAEQPLVHLPLRLLQPEHVLLLSGQQPLQLPLLRLHLVLRVLQNRVLRQQFFAALFDVGDVVSVVSLSLGQALQFVREILFLRAPGG